ncbi:MAG: DUF2851 family protein [Paludibacter sp.]|nr:DUF2851 family protein [Paludibacter sp.]MBP8783369.1 DUF2851 family protein [Paludibacter sp.]
MKESILHFIWQNKLFQSHSLLTTDGESVEVIDPGRLNTDAGPDFFNAKIKLGNTIWAGNVEIHTRSSEWARHGHDDDKAYNSVVLHVVKKADVQVFRADGAPIPQLELIYPAEIEENYGQLMQNSLRIPCENKISAIPGIFIRSWKNALLTERLLQKTENISEILSQNNRHWEEAFYLNLARSFGFGTNGQAFEMLAASLPMQILGKHKNDLSQLEALLFGQAGLLAAKEEDAYLLSLRKEYDFLKIKYDLKPIDGSQWKLLRLRPDNFPHVRIAQFAALIHKSTGLFSKITENPDIQYLQGIFRVEPSEYWKTHYLFAHESHKSLKGIGQKAIEGIIINTVVPFLFSFADTRGNQSMKDKAIEILEKLPAENNVITRMWHETGIDCASAFDSQALIQLKKMYCDKRNCLRCRIGHKVLTIDS